MTDALAIFLLQLVYVPLLTLRTTFVVKGKKVQASLFAFLEAIIYIVSLGIVFSDLKNFLNIGAYIIGYGIGIYIGGRIEERLAIGYRSIHVNLTNYNEDLVNKLRELHFGVTAYEGEGMKKEKRYKLEIVSHRSRENEVISLIQSFEKNAFIVSYEPTQFKGGYITKQLKKF
ncbi:MAG: DUF2179 domain-containing protein [Clostridium sp.]|uniref:DUF5698 domain-containing protein n=1 Tax=Clostridium sp. TaxID=1506 RepID=UPI0025B9FEF7|nr:DUF5698 domain-containing protein [Clostridium sp.]MCF0147343.1 DUF2179 domain-containing protein [Clostridium sp.]